MALEVRLLGTVEAHRDGTRVELHGEQLRTLLAYLALTPGTSRPIDGIIDALWPIAERGGAMPTDPRPTVHTYASRIRSALGHDSIVTRDGGYALGVAPVDVDVGLFEALVHSAGEPGCSAVRRVEVLDKALALWRGQALDGFHDREWARPDATRLQEMRAIAEDDRAEALLTVGDATAAVPLLTAAASISPLRERTHALLMTALQRSGRQAEALRVFQQYRRRLATDLGLDPGDGIKELDRSIASGERASPDLASGGRAVPGYVLLERIGDGKFAVVYRGRQSSVEREVAIKVIRSELADRPEFVRRFETEAQLVANLEHPHIVPLYDFWRTPGCAYLVMRLFPAGTLEDLILKGPLQLDDVTRLVRQIGAALATAHAAGVVHRDVKPANICVDAQGNFYLGDFGIAYEAMVGYVATDSVSVGSPSYASPEQLMRQPVGPAADVHGLAITVFESLSGPLPFADSTTQAERLRHQLNDPLPSWESSSDRWAPGAVARVSAVLRRASAEDPAHRLSSVDEFVADFLGAVDGVDAPLSAQQDEHAVATATDGLLRNPYKGLRPFHEADAGDFYGRARLVDRLVDLLRGDDVNGRILTVVGPSGSGKSSVVRAGLLPRLRAGTVSGSERWFITAMVPGARPFAELELALSRISIEGVAGIAESMGAERHGIARSVRRLVDDDDCELLLLIDQFEELFTLCTDSRERDRFIAGLVEAVTEPRSQLRVVLTLRADFFDRPLRFRELGSLVERSAVAVIPLAADEVEAAIIEPARGAGVEFERGLAARIVADVVDQPGALPLLQYMLTELFERREAGVVTIGAYEALGGLTGVIARRGEQLYTAASDDEQIAIRRLFTRLVSLGEGTEDTRRRVKRFELGDSSDMQSAIDRFGAARLLAFDRDPTSREQTVEVAHEALLGEWPRLHSWIDEDRDGLRLHRHITTSASSWEASGRDESEQYRGARLEAAAQWVAVHRLDLNEPELAFIAASEDLNRATQAAALRSARRLRRSLVAVATIAVVALIAGGLAWGKQREATHSRRAADAAALEATQQRDAAQASATEGDRQRRAAEGATADASAQRETAQQAAFTAETERVAAIAPKLAKTDPTLGLLLAAEANGRDRSNPNSLGALQDVLAAENTLGYIRPGATRPGYLFQQVGYDTAGNIVTFGGTPSGSSWEEEIVVWDGVTHSRLRSIPVSAAATTNGGTRDVAIGSDKVAWIDERGGVRTADLVTGDQTSQGTADAVGVGINGLTRQLVVVNMAGEVLVFDDGQTDPRWRSTGDGAGPEQPAFVVFNASGTKIYVSRSSGVRAFDMTSGDEIGAFEHPAALQTWQFIAPLESDDTKVVLGNTFDPLLVDIDDGTPPVALVLPLPNSDPVNVLAVGGDRYAWVDNGGTVTIADHDDRALVGPIELHSGRAWAVALAPDGRTMVVAGDNGAVVIALDQSSLMRTVVPAPTDFHHFIGISDRLMYASPTSNEPKSFKPVTGTYWQCDLTCQEWNAIPRTTSDIPYPEVNGWIPVATFGQPGTTGPMLNVYDENGVSHGSGPTPAGYVLPSAVFVPRSGAWVAFASYDADLRGTLEVHALPDWSLLHGPVPLGLVFLRLTGTTEPNQLLLVDSYGGPTRTIDTTTWTMASIAGDLHEVADAVFSANGTLLATANTAGVVSIRDTSTFKVERSLSGATATTNILIGSGLAMTDDSRYLLTALDGRARLWNLATGEPIGDPIGDPIDLGIVPSRPQVLGGRVPLYVAMTDGLLQIWRFDVDHYHEIACQAAGRNMTQQEWERYGPRNEPYHATCPQWPAT